jgi:hypothetical protein
MLRDLSGNVAMVTGAGGTIVADGGSTLFGNQELGDDFFD